jgi:hypothetical protein
VLEGKEVHDMVDVLDEIVEDDFQIKAVDALAVVLWAGALILAMFSPGQKLLGCC